MYLKALGAVLFVLFIGWLAAGAPIKSETVRPALPTSVCDYVNKWLYPGATFDGVDYDPNGGKELIPVYEWVKGELQVTSKEFTRLVPITWVVEKMNPGCFSMEIFKQEHPNQTYHQSTDGWW